MYPVHELPALETEKINIKQAFSMKWIDTNILHSMLGDILLIYNDTA